MAEDLSTLNALLAGASDKNDLIDKLRGLLGLPNSGRSPGWKPLKDMRAPQTSKGRLNRPHFEWSADDDGSTVIPPFPRLYWDANGIERRIEDEEDLLRKVGPGWTDRPPMATAMTAADRAQAELAMLSDEDRQFVLEAQKKTRLDRIREQLSGLSPTDIAAVIAAQPVKLAAAKKDDKQKTA